MTKETFVFLPYWVESAIKRNGLNLEICLDYGQLRSILSLEDMSGLLALQDIKAVTRDESVLSRTLLNSWAESAKGTHETELNTSIIPLSRSTELKEEIFKRLSEETNQPSIWNSGTADLTSTYFKVVELGRSGAAQVLYPGYPNFISNPENEYAVVKTQLQLFYVYLKTYQVSVLPVFRRYLSLLANKASSPAVA